MECHRLMDDMRRLFFSSFVPARFTLSQFRLHIGSRRGAGPVVFLFNTHITASCSGWNDMGGCRRLLFVFYDVNAEERERVVQFEFA